MGAEWKDLIKIKQVTDHDTGTYYMGEIDGSYNRGELDNFFKSYGMTGKDELLSVLSNLIYRIEHQFRKLPDAIRFQGADQAAQMSENKDYCLKTVSECEEDRGLKKPLGS